MDKHSSLLRKSVNYSRNNFYDTGPWFINPLFGVINLIITAVYKYARLKWVFNFYQKCQRSQAKSLSFTDTKWSDWGGLGSEAS